MNLMVNYGKLWEEECLVAEREEEYIFTYLYYIAPSFIPAIYSSFAPGANKYF